VNDTTSSALNGMMSELAITAKRKMLKWHAGQVMFCPGCEQVLDCRRAVELDFMQGGELKASKITCASCWESKLKGHIEAQAEEHGYTLEVTDGRVLFGNGRKGRKNS